VEETLPLVVRNEILCIIRGEPIIATGCEKLAHVFVHGDCLDIAGEILPHICDNQLCTYKSTFFDDITKNATTTPLYVKEIIF
jgi:hypothetical protein